MLDLNDFFYFVQLVDCGGFTAAGRVLRVPKSTLSHRLRRLEEDLDVRLLNRTSRRFSMTEAGQEFYRHAVAMLHHAGQAETLMRQRRNEPSGIVRITTPLAVAQFGLQTIIADFIALHPKVDLVQHASNRQIDLVGENFDVAIRAHSGPLPDSAMVQRILAPAPWHLYAGAALMDQAGHPETPGDLIRFPSLFMIRGDAPASWTLRGPRDETFTLPLSPRLTSDDLMSLKNAAVAGLGVVALPDYVCREDMRAHRLVRLLPDWLAAESTLTALLPHQRGLLPSVRAFVDHLVAEFPRMLAGDQASYSSSRSL